jgi:GDPmannose 4,6-dehydratase
MFACNGILFNHESPLRGETFVTRKITRAVAKIALGRQTKLYLGNLSAQRDWGHAKDYIEGMYLILQQDKPEDFVLATGITTTVRDFVKKSFNELGIEIEFEGKDENEIAKVINCSDNIKLATGSIVVEVDAKYFRPTEVDLLIGDATKAKEKLNWIPKYNLSSLIKEMVQNDYLIEKNKI